MRVLAAGFALPGSARRPIWPALGSSLSQWRRQVLGASVSRRALTQRTQASAVKEDRKTTSGRKGDGLGTTSGRPTTTSNRSPSHTTSGRKAETGVSHGSSGSSSSRGTSPQRPPSPPPPQRRPPSPTSSKAGSQQRASRLDTYMRKHPLFSRFYDTTLLLGDCVMILATEASSERIEWSSFPTLVGVLLVCWVAAGAVNGDYSPGGTRAHEDVPWQLSMLGPTFGSVLGAALTWAFASTAAAGAYAVLVARNALDAAPVVEGLNTDDLSPQLEVLVALLITMTCWRGIASKLRPTLPDE